MVFFEDCYIVYNENKRRTKIKEMECEQAGLLCYQRKLPSRA